MKIKNIILAVATAFVMTACSGGSPFGGVASAIDDLSSFNRNPGFKISDKDGWKKYDEKSKELKAKIKEEGQKLDGKEIKPDLNGNVEIISPIKLSFEEVHDCSVEFTFAGTGKFKKDVEFKPFNSYWAEEMREGNSGVTIFLAFPDEHEKIGYTNLLKASEVPVVYENGRYFVKADTEFPIEGDFWITCDNVDIYKSGKMCMIINGGECVQL